MHHQIMKDRQDLKDVPQERHADKMPSSQPDYLATYKNNNVTDIKSHSICKYTLINKQSVLQYNFLKSGIKISELYPRLLGFGSIVESV